MLRQRMLRQSIIGFYSKYRWDSYSLIKELHNYEFVKDEEEILAQCEVDKMNVFFEMVRAR